MSRPAVGARTLAAFGLIAVPLATGGLPVALYLAPFYARELGLGLTGLGLVLTLIRLSDVLTDPLIGMLSDRTPARCGRRGLWIALGVPVMAGATWAVFVPPAAPGLGYVAVSFGLLYFGWTLIGIPLNAWVAEITPDYHERTRLSGAPAGGTVARALLAILAPLAVVALARADVAPFAGAPADSLAPTLRVLAWLTIAALLVSVPWLLVSVPQPGFTRRGQPDLRRGLALIAGNRAFRRLLLSSVCAAVGWHSINTLFVFFATFYLGASQAEWPLILLAWMGAQLVGTPLVVRLAPRFEKHRMVALLSLVQVALFALVLVLPPGGWRLYALLSLVTGLLAPVVPVLGPSMA
ncbi:MAG: MFS transporter, partial [Gammaproteobacteria bacterium]